jgi:small subunit ribosomal protein S4
MGDPKFARKHYQTPSHPWDGARISEENMIIRKYGLKNKRELWKIQTILRNLRRQARKLQARLRTSDEQAIMERDALLERLMRQGLLSNKDDLTDVLSLEVEALLARRLQTQIYLKGMARTVKQARQLIVHGHIGVDGRKVTVPSYLVANTETALIDFYLNSPMGSDMHPERAAADFAPQMTTVKEERRVSEEKERDMRRSREIERIAAMRRAITKANEEEKDEEATPEDGDKTSDAPADGEKAPEKDAPKKEDPKEKGKEKAPKEDASKKAPVKEEKPKKGGES